MGSQKPSPEMHSQFILWKDIRSPKLGWHSSYWLQRTRQWQGPGGTTDLACPSGQMKEGIAAFLVLSVTEFTAPLPSLLSTLHLALCGSWPSCTCTVLCHLRRRHPATAGGVPEQLQCPWAVRGGQAGHCAGLQPACLWR